MTVAEQARIYVLKKEIERSFKAIRVRKDVKCKIKFMLDRIKSVLIKDYFSSEEVWRLGDYWWYTEFAKKYTETLAEEMFGKEYKTEISINGTFFKIKVSKK